MTWESSISSCPPICAQYALCILEMGLDQFSLLKPFPSILVFCNHLLTLVVFVSVKLLYPRNCFHIIQFVCSFQERQSVNSASPRCVPLCGKSVAFYGSFSRSTTISLFLWFHCSLQTTHSWFAGILIFCNLLFFGLINFHLLIILHTFPASHGVNPT